MFRKKWDFWPAWLWACFQMHWVCNNAFHWPHHPTSNLKREKRRRIRRVTKLTRFRYFAPARPTLYIGKMTNYKFCGHALSLDKVFFSLYVQDASIEFCSSGHHGKIRIFAPLAKKNIFTSAQRTGYFGTPCQGKYLCTCGQGKPTDFQAKNFTPQVCWNPKF